MATEEKAGAHAQEIPTRFDLIQRGLRLYDMALGVKRECEDGRRWITPEVGSACKALELVARLCGHLGDSRGMSIDQLRTELDRMGWKLVPKHEAVVLVSKADKSA